jgi:hypothetical protein
MRAPTRADTQITKPETKAVDCGPRSCRQAGTASARQRQAFPHPSRHLETSSLRTSSARGRALRGPSGLDSGGRSGSLLRARRGLTTKARQEEKRVYVLTHTTNRRRSLTRPLTVDPGVELS